MSFARQLVLVLFMVVLLALGARAMLTVHETREYLSRQLESHARDAARSLGLSISLHLAQGDDLFMESVVDSLFDSGDYESIRVHDLDGSVRLVRERRRSPVDVPAWFADLVPIDAPVGNAVLTAGWNAAGQVSVRSHPGYAYEQLWESTVRSAMTVAVFLALALPLIGVVVRVLLRPLQVIESQARAVADRSFPLIEHLPRTREFRRVAQAMNFMTGSVEKFIADQREQARQLQADAYLDPITGLRNRRALLMDVAQMVRQARSEGPGAMLLVNVRGLEAVNRQSGYESGDDFVRAIAARLTACVSIHARDDAVAVGRWGGAIFALVLPRASRESVAELAGDLVASIAAPAHDGAEAEAVNAGAVLVEGDDAADLVVEHCEAALRGAERRGPGAWRLWGVEVANVTMQPSDEAEQESLVRRVIARREVVLEAQPVLDGEAVLVHEEVLARVRADDGTLLPAARFVPVAIRLGLGAQLDEIVVEKALELLAADAAGEARLAVNLSPPAASDPQFREWLAARLSRTAGSERARLSVEVTEHFVVGNGEAMRALIDALRPLGVGLGVDQCGAAQNSLSALQGLPVDYAKLYGALVSGIDGDRERQHLLRSLVSIGHGMGLMVIAEYVETEAELALTRTLGFDAAQGFLLGRPAPLG